MTVKPGLYDLDDGTFEVKSGKLLVTDPCYDLDLNEKFESDIMGCLQNVKNGKWEAQVKMVPGWGVRPSHLFIRHSECKDDMEDCWQTATFDVCVDSGQAGFFDLDQYPKGERAEDGKFNKDQFYDFACAATLGQAFFDHSSYKEIPAGYVNGVGAVSSSGYGDGSYVCRYNTQDGEIVSAVIEFISDEEEDGIEEEHLREEDDVYEEPDDGFDEGGEAGAG